jgi:hypothetical protein
MKKRLFLIPLLFGLAACGGSSLSNQEEVNRFKELLNKQDLSEFTSKSLATMFIQEYDVLDVSRDMEEEESSSNYFNYVGLGFLDSSYELTKEEYDGIVDENGQVNTFDAIARGEGGYRITQTAKTASFYRDGGMGSTTENLDIAQQMTLKTSEEDVVVFNVLAVTDQQAYDTSTSQRFHGQINKDLLFGSVSTRSFREIFSAVNLFDAPGNVESLDRFYYSLCRELTTKSDQEISEFLLRNQIALTEAEDALELRFVFQGDDMGEDYVDSVFPGTIEGTLFFDKATGFFDEFEYEIKHMSEIYDETTGSLKTSNMNFTCAGKSSHSPLGDMWTPDNPTVYENVIDFLGDVSDQVIPPNILQ